MISSRDISRETGLPLNLSAKILLTLSEENIINLDPIFCSHCNVAVTSFPDDGRCNNCVGDLNLQESISVTINGSLDRENQINLSKLASTNRSAKRLAEAWKRKRYIYYLILDLVASQSVQEQLRDDGYYSFLAEIRKIATYKVLSHIKGAYLSFGENGDMHKMGFENSEDAIKAVCLLSKNLPERSDTIKEETPFPCYSASISKLELPTAEKGKFCDPSDLISTTINGVPEINSIALTNIFRYYHEIKTDYSIYEGNCDISLWYFTPIIGKKNASTVLPKRTNGINQNIPKTAWHSFRFNKNGSIGTNEAFMVYIKKGAIGEIEKNPHNIIRKG